MDCRERIVENLKNTLLINFNVADVERISRALIVELGKYIISDNTNEIAVRDNSDEKLIEVYGSVLLTEGKSPKTVLAYVELLKRYAKQISKRVTDATVFDIRVWLASMQKQVSLRTCDTYRAYLSAFYQRLEKEEIIAKNPMNKITPIKYTKEIKKPFDDVEIDALRGACRTQRHRAVLETMLASGVRVSELCGLKRSDINFDKMELTVREGKGGKQRIVYINDVAVAHIKKYLNERLDASPYLFVSKNGDRLSSASIELNLKEIGKRANVDDVHPHRCRRTFATSLAKRGMDIRTIQLLMGHSNVNTTMIYVNMDNEHVQNEYKKYA